MAAELAVQRFPSAKFLHGHIATFQTGPDSGCGAEAVKQAVRAYGHHPCGITLHVFIKASWQQADVLKVECLSLHRHDIFDLQLVHILSGIQ